MVEIAKALATDARILVMDEPTAALDDTEAARLLALVRRLRADGVAVIYVSHRMPEIAAVSDRVTVLKDGRKVATDATSAMPPDRLVRLMVGRDLAEFFPPRGTGSGEVLLQVRGGGNAVLSGIDLEVRRGEIVGVAGLEGSGKSALARAIFGDEPFTSGELRLDGKPLALRSARDGIMAGIGLLPDDRKRDGVAPGQSLAGQCRAHLAGLRGRAAASASRPHGQCGRSTRTCGRSTCGPRGSTRRSGCCPAAISRRSSSRAGSPATRSC